MRLMTIEGACHPSNTPAQGMTSLTRLTNDGRRTLPATTTVCTRMVRHVCSRVQCLFVDCPTFLAHGEAPTKPCCRCLREWWHTASGETKQTIRETADGSAQLVRYIKSIKNKTDVRLHAPRSPTNAPRRSPHSLQRRALCMRVCVWDLDRIFASFPSFFPAMGP